MKIAKGEKAFHPFSGTGELALSYPRFAWCKRLCPLDKFHSKFRQVTCSCIYIPLSSGMVKEETKFVRSNG